MPELNLDTILGLVHAKGVPVDASVGGSYAKICAGDQRTSPRGDVSYAACAGPFDVGGGTAPCIGHTDEFFVGADDQGETSPVDCAAVGALTDQAVAELIVAQAALLPGAVLTPAQAEEIARASQRAAEADRGGARSQAQ